MAHAKHYVPGISRFMVCVLFHEGKRRNVPMTRLVDELLTNALKDSPGWKVAEQQLLGDPAPSDRIRHKADH